MIIDEIMRELIVSSASNGDMVGSAWLSREYGIELVQPLRYTSRIGRVNVFRSVDGIHNNTFQASYAPANTLAGHLDFMLRHERIHLELLSRLFAAHGETEISQWTRREPAGRNARRAAWLYEWLTGNLLADANKTAIEITSSNVSFDLNGFTIACNTVPVGLNPVSFFCVGNEPFGFSPPLRGLTVRNGSITVTSKGPALNLTLIFALSLIRDAGLFEGLQIQTDVDASYASTFYRIGPNSIIRSNIFTGASQIFTDCPSLVERNVNAGQAGRSQFSGCIFVNNIGLF